MSPFQTLKKWRVSGITQVCMRTSPNGVQVRDMRSAVKAFSLCAEHVFQERYAATEAALLENSVYSCPNINPRYLLPEYKPRF